MSREMLQLVDVLAKEKNVSKEIVFSAVEMALAQATKKRLNEDADIRVTIDRASGEFDSFRSWRVVHDAEYVNEFQEIPLSEAQKDDPECEVGDVLEEPIEKVDFGRIGAQAAKQVILQRIRDAEREQVFNDFLERGEHIISGVVKRVERGGVVVESGKVEAFLPRDQLIPKENLRSGDRIKAYLQKVERTPRGPQIILSRTDPQFVLHLFRLEVPEIGDGLIELKACARDPGLRAKVAVKSNDQRIEPIGTCVGLRGSRVSAVRNEICGENLDIVLWSADPAQYVIKALAPAEISSIVVDEDQHAMDVVTDEDNLAIAIGRNGQNVRLASDLTGWTINLLTEDEANEKVQAEYETVLKTFMGKLEVDEETANLLIAEGFSTIEEIGYLPVAELLTIEGLDEATITELRNRARNVLLTDAIATEEKLENVAEDLLSLPHMDKTLAASLSLHKIKNREDLANLDVDELMEISGLDETRAKEMIMAARAPWFE